MTGSPTLEGGAMSALTRAFGRRRVAVTAALLTVVVAAVGAAAATAASRQAGGTITVLAFNLLGDGVRDALDPKT
jgi:ABC-type glycerol-3-phosphate transport system substrate-binding protein